MPLFQRLPLLTKPLHHVIQQLIAQIARRVISVCPFNHFHDLPGFRFDGFESRLFVLCLIEGRAGPLDRLFGDRFDLRVIKGQQAVEIAADDLAQIIVADSRTVRTAVPRPAGHVVAHQIPILGPLPLVNRSAGTHGRAAMGAERDSTENAVPERRICRMGLCIFAQKMLGQIKLFLGDQGFMGTFREIPVFFRNRNLSPGFHIDLSRLAQNGVAQIDPVAQDALHCGGIPVIRRPGGSLRCKFIPILHPVFEGRDHPFLVQPVGNASRRQPRRRPGENLFYHRSGIFVRGKLVGGVLRFFIAIGRAGRIFPVFPFQIQGLLHFPGGIAQIDVVHGELERRHGIISHGIKVISRRQIVDIMLREVPLGVVAGFGHITAKPGQVLGHDHIGLSRGQMLQHGLKPGPFEVAAGVAVIGKLFYQNDAALLTIISDNGSLVCNAL